MLWNFSWFFCCLLLLFCFLNDFLKNSFKKNKCQTFWIQTQHAELKIMPNIEWFILHIALWSWKTWFVKHFSPCCHEFLILTLLIFLSWNCCLSLHHVHIFMRMHFRLILIIDASTMHSEKTAPKEAVWSGLVGYQSAWPIHSGCIFPSLSIGLVLFQF